MLNERENIKLNQSLLVVERCLNSHSCTIYLLFYLKRIHNRNKQKNILFWSNCTNGKTKRRQSEQG